MFTLNVEINTKSYLEGISIALEEVKKKIEEGFNRGFDGNDEEGYSFHLKDSEHCKS